MTALHFLWLVPALPLLGAVLMAAFGRKLEPQGSAPAKLPGRLCSGLVALSFVVAAFCCLEIWGLPGHRYEFRGSSWFAGGEWGLLLDPLSAELTLLISGIGSLVHIYSLAYMERDGGQYRFFGGLNFFVAAMQILVLANNYVLLFAGWEGVGFASYLLIGFDYERWSAGVAGMKAFIINRAADAGFLLGIFFLILKSGTAHFGTIEISSRHWSSTELTLAAALLMVGAMGKSAQFPLHIWLPDAMEGPTPVSALIHSATMVCAGVYLIVRSGFLFAHAPEVSLAVSIIGVITALVAATIALVENDIKRVLAYSTVSQIGFMFLALGAGAYTAALFHLFTHAFFKSILFLGSGSIIHALDGEQNLKHMGGLRRRMPGTFLAMLLGSLALAAVPGFAGFFSKDLILGESLGLPNGWLFFAFALLTSLLTACYAGRLMCLAFFGEYRHAIHPHEAPKTMLVPMYILGAGCVVAGWAPSLIHWSEWPLMLVSAALAFVGLSLAWRFYVVTPESRTSWDHRFGFLIRFLRNRWYIDALYEESILNGVILRSAEGAAVVDSHLVDAGVNGAALGTAFTSRLLRWFDRSVIDGLVRFSAATAQVSSSCARALQSGLVQTYALLFIAGLLVALGYYLK
jgi:NADH-quinone oxidoreductase subunit L